MLAGGEDYLQYAGPGYGFLGLGGALFFACQGAGWPVFAGFLRMATAVLGGMADNARFADGGKDMNQHTTVTVGPETIACSCGQQRLMRASLDDRVREAARLVISPSGHADDDRLQAAFKLLRAEAPVYWVDTPGVRPFWLISRHADVMAVERKRAPFSAEPRTFLSSEMAEDRLRRILGKPYVLRGLLQMDDPDHGAYRAVAQPRFTPAALAAFEPWLADHASKIVERNAGRTDVFDFVEQLAVPFSIRGIMQLMGLPEADDALILKLSRGLVGPEDPERRLADRPTEALCRAGIGFSKLFRSRRHRTPGLSPRRSQQCHRQRPRT